MAAIRWVCLSDLHLGALNSILSSVSPDGSGIDKSQTSPVTTTLCDGLRVLGLRDGPPQLIVAGDLFELALSSTDDASATFAQFICGLRPGEASAAVARRSDSFRGTMTKAVEPGPQPQLCRLPGPGGPRCRRGSRIPGDPPFAGQRPTPGAG